MQIQNLWSLYSDNLKHFRSCFGAGESANNRNSDCVRVLCFCTSQHVTQWYNCEHEWTSPRLDSSICCKIVPFCFTATLPYIYLLFILRLLFVFASFFFSLLLLSSSARAPILINPTVRLSTHFVVKQINEPDCLKKCSQPKMARNESEMRWIVIENENQLPETENVRSNHL